MEPLVRIRSWILTPKLYQWQPKRSFNSGKISCAAPKPSELFYNVSELLKKYHLMVIADKSLKRSLENEFLSECLIENCLIPVKNWKLQYLLNLPIEDLQEKNLVSSSCSIIDKFLSYLEPFPFDKQTIWNSRAKGKMNLKIIRGAIEKEYLAWKFQVDVKKINFILSNVRLYSYISFEHLRNNISFLETVPDIQQKSVAKKIYYAYHKSLDVNNVLNFQEKLAGVPWFVFPFYCPKVLTFSYELILFVVSVLETLKFSKRQIQIGLPFLNFHNFSNQLDNLLKTQQLQKFRYEPEYLQLLYFNRRELSSLACSNASSLKEFLKLKLENFHQRKIPSGYILDYVTFLISESFEVDKSKLICTYYYPNYNSVSALQIYETLTFLKKLGFTMKEIEDSSGIIFYESNLIARTLDKIKNEKESLKKIGYNEEFESEAHSFINGTKEKRKLLQLCLYYIEKLFHFSGKRTSLPKNPAI